ncbi:hypothetical protein [Dactylosporangium maewongense]|uniref:hypothetical protein n=1 Tax=Dactylosporangium TaxID=35753 RepID=UPI0031D16A9F
MPRRTARGILSFNPTIGTRADRGTSGRVRVVLTQGHTWRRAGCPVSCLLVAVVDWLQLQDPGVEVAALLDRAEREPSTEVWERLDKLLIVEAECWYSAGFAALPRLSALAYSGAAEHRAHAIDLAAMIAMTLHRHHRDDDLVRANPAALATLHRLAASRLPSMSGGQLLRSFQAACALAGYTFWATISLDFTDEHYRTHCPHCATPLMIVIGDYGHYAAIRDHDEGDILRTPLHPVEPETLHGFRRWMHETAVACGDPILADGLTYLFGDATCSSCHSVFNVADWYEAENSPAQPIDPVIPRVDRST